VVVVVVVTSSKVVGCRSKVEVSSFPDVEALNISPDGLAGGKTVSIACSSTLEDEVESSTF